MNIQDAEKVITEYMKPIYGFALKNCKNMQDAEDLSQEIMLRAFRTLIMRDDVDNLSGFIWTIAHNALNNYYRDAARSSFGVPLDEVAECLVDPESDIEPDDTAETIVRLQSEIAYLSKLQRRIIIAYYFENKKQDDIARELGIPLGTLKWHLFEAKKDLKRGMDKMRKTSELKFNPIRFDSYGINGSIGEKPIESYLRSPLVQNICYAARDKAMTVAEIADALGVSPVYVESEAEYLEKYGFLTRRKDKYITNFLINEPTSELLIMKDSMYKKAAGLFANELYDTLTESGIIDDPDIICGQTDEPISLTVSERADRNFILWSLIPYIAACSGEELMDETISFDEAATIRPDGAQNICCATVITNELKLPDDFIYMKDCCGPSWNGVKNHILWRFDTEWSGKRILADSRNREEAMRILTLYQYEYDGVLLSADDYAWLAERGFVKTNGDYNGYFKSSWQVVILANTEIRDKLLSIGGEIKAKYKAVFDDLKAPYVKALLESYPEHVRKMAEYGLQFIFHSDSWFLLHCIITLLNSGKLKPPTENQKRSLSTLIIPE